MSKQEPVLPAWNNQKSISFYLNMLAVYEHEFLSLGITQEQFNACDWAPNPTWNFPQPTNQEAWASAWETLAAAQQRGHRDGSFDHGEEMAKTLAALHGEDHPSVQKARDRGKELKAYENRHNSIKVVRNKEKYLQDNLDADRDLMQPIEMVDDQEMAERRKRQETNERLDKLGIERG